MEEKDKLEEVAGLDIGNLPVNQERSDENPGDEKEEEVKAGDESAEGADETSVEENKVSYSRFKNVHSRYREAEQRAQELEQRLQELESQRSERIERETPSYEGKKWTTWVKLYGDTPQSREAYQDFMSEFAPPDESYIRQLAQQAYQQEQMAETRRIESNERTIDDELEDLSVIVGRELTDDEQVAVLEIMDKNSLTDDNGRILKLYPAEQAWDIYEIEAQAGKASRTESRNKVAQAISSGARGTSTSSKSQEDKAFDPRWEALDSSLNKRR